MGRSTIIYVVMISKTIERNKQRLKQRKEANKTTVVISGDNSDYKCQNEDSCLQI